VIAGVTTNCCVDSTMRDAYFRDFNVLVVSDCVAAFGGEADLHDATLKKLSPGCSVMWRWRQRS
jgi:nicotinamidase-related amidase